MTIVALLVVAQLATNAPDASQEPLDEAQAGDKAATPSALIYNPNLPFGAPNGKPSWGTSSDHLIDHNYDTGTTDEDENGYLEQLNNEIEQQDRYDPNARL